MDDAASFIRKFPLEKFSQGSTLVYQDEIPSHLYALKSGFVKINDFSLDGNEQLIWLAKKYDFIPLEWLFGETKSSPYFYTAFTDVEAYAVDKAEFIKYVSQNNAALLGIIGALSEKYHDALKHLNAVQKPKAHERIVGTLLFLAERFTDSSPSAKSITVTLTHQHIANLAGVTRETVSLELKKLKDQGLINYDRQSFYIYPDKLAELD